MLSEAKKKWLDEIEDDFHGYDDIPDAKGRARKRKRIKGVSVGRPGAHRAKRARAAPATIPAQAAAAKTAQAAAAQTATTAAHAAAENGLIFPSWSDVLEIFLSANPGVQVFGVFGEGALPGPTTLLAPAAPTSLRPPPRSPFPLWGGGSAGAALWSVLSSSVTPTAVVARSRAWSGEDGDGVAAAMRGVDWSKGEWLSDKLVAQVSKT